MRLKMLEKLDYGRRKHQKTIDFAFISFEVRGLTVPNPRPDLAFE